MCQVVISGFISTLRATLYLSGCVLFVLTVVKLITGTNEQGLLVDMAFWTFKTVISVFPCVVLQYKKKCSPIPF